VTVRDTETRTIGEAALGGDTRKTTLVNGNDKLDIELGGQHITMAMDQSVTAGLTITLMANVNITLQVGPSQIILTPGGIVINAPTIAMTAQGAMALTAGGLPTGAR
jgi:type VI secretion system secreted protein VgrG